jgi:hypothetical protein
MNNYRYKMSDNFFPKCPAMMSDGRFLTDYRADVRANEYIKYINGIERDDDYRLFLQANGEQIMDNQWNYLRKNKSCWVNECVHNYPTRMYPPWFTEERKAADSLFDPKRSTRYLCPIFNDYRATHTNSSRY